MSHFHRVQSFRNRLLQCGFSTCHSSCQQTCSCKCSAPQVPVPARSLLLHGLSMGCSFLQGTSTCCGVGSSMGCRVDICSSVVLHRLQVDDLLPHGLLHRLQENLCFSAWSTSSPPSSLTLVFAELLLSCFLTPLYPSCCTMFFNLS